MKKVEDTVIINLYFDRSEKAIQATEEKYSRYCFSIAWNVLYDKEDSNECVNDTWLATWNSIPPRKPAILSAFLGKITRNLAIWCATRQVDKLNNENFFLPRYSLCTGLFMQRFLVFVHGIPVV